MIRPILLIAPFTLCILFATAQTADSVPTLDELLRLYEKYELPMPPKDAKFVRYETGLASSDDEGKRLPDYQSFAFVATPRTRTKQAVVLRGVEEFELYSLSGMWELKPKSSSLIFLRTNESLDLCIAIQAHKLGHRELADYLYTRSRKELKESPGSRIRDLAWAYWLNQIKEPNRDRKVVLKNLIAIDRESNPGKEYRTSGLLRSFELAVEPGKGKLGTIDALIDDLVHVKGQFYSLWSILNYDKRLQKIAERGFDAVPALLEHLNDERLTRAELSASYSFVTANLTVGDLCGALLQNLAAGDIPRDKEKEERERLERVKEFDKFEKETGKSIGKLGSLISRPAVVTVSHKDSKAWWDKVQKTGEKQHTLSHIFSKVTVDGVERTVHQFPLAVIRAKYPNELAVLYRKALDESTGYLHTDIVTAVSDSPLPQKEKRAILEFGLQHKDCSKRRAAFGALADVEAREFEEKLLVLLDAYPSKNPEDDWECLGTSPVGFSMDAATPKVLASLEKAMKRAPVDLRLLLISWLSNFIDDDGKHRLIRIQLLCQFLDDAEACPKTKRETASSAGLPEGYDGIEVRNYTAIKLAEYYHERIENDRKRTADEWKAIRERLRREAIAELAESKR